MVEDREYVFDHVYYGRSTQEDICDHRVIKNLAKDTVQGLNAAIILYGSLGSGKTFTLVGTKANLGILPRLTCELFRQIADFKSANPTDELVVQICALEVRNSFMYNLLLPHSDKSKNNGVAIGSFPSNPTTELSKTLVDRVDVREHPKVGTFLVVSAKPETSAKVTVSSAEEAIVLLSNAAHRHQSKHSKISNNADSIRSECT